MAGRDGIGLPLCRLIASEDMGIFIEVDFLVISFLLFALAIWKKVYVLSIHHSNDDYRLQIPRLVRHVPGLLILLHKQQNINLPRSEMISICAFARLSNSWT